MMARGQHFQAMCAAFVKRVTIVSRRSASKATIKRRVCATRDCSRKKSKQSSGFDFRLSMSTTFVREVEKVPPPPFAEGTPSFKKV